MTALAVGANDPFVTDLNTLERRLLYISLAAKATFAGLTFNLDNGDNSQVLYVDVQKSYVRELPKNRLPTQFARAKEEQW